MGSAVVKPLTRRRGKIKSDDPVAKNANVNQVENVGNCEPHVNFKVDTLADPVSNLCKPVSVKSSDVDAGDTQPSPVVYRVDRPTQYDSDEEPYPIPLARTENTNTNVAVDVRENARVDAASRNSDISSKESIKYVPHLPLEPRKHPPVSIDSRRFKGISCLFKSSNTVTCPSFRTFRKNAENKASENVETTPATAMGEEEATKPEVNLEEKDVCCDARTPSPEYDVLEVVETNPRLLEKSVPSPTHSSVENHNGMCRSPHTNEELTSFEPLNSHCEIDSLIPNVITDQIDSLIPNVITDQIDSLVPNVITDQIDSFVPDVINDQPDQIDSFVPDVITEKCDHKDSFVPDVIIDQVDSFIADASTDQSELIPDTVQMFVQPAVSEVSCNDREVEDFLSNSRHQGGPQVTDRDSAPSQPGDDQMPDPSPPQGAEYGLQLIEPDERDSLNENKADLQLDRGETQSHSVYVLQGKCEINPSNPYTATVVCSINSAQPSGDCHLPNIGDTQDYNLPSMGDTQDYNLPSMGETQAYNLPIIGDTQDHNAPSISDSQDKLDQLDIMEMEAVKCGNEEDLEMNDQYDDQSEEDTMQVLDSCDIGESYLPSEQGEICTLNVDQSQTIHEANHGAGDVAANVHTVKDVCGDEDNQYITQEETCLSFDEIVEKRLSTEELNETRLSTEEIDEKRLSIDKIDEKRLHPDDSSSGCVSADNNDDLCDSGADDDKRVDSTEGAAAPRLSSSHNQASDNNILQQSHRQGTGEADGLFRYSRRCSDSNSRSSSARSSKSSKCSTCSETGLVDNLQLARDLSCSSKSSLIKSTSDLPPSVKGSEHVISVIEATREGQRSRPVSARSKTPLMDNVLLCRSETQNSLSSHSSGSLVRRSPCVVEETIIPLKSSSCKMELSHSARQSPRSPRPISAKSYTSHEQKPTGIRSRPVSASHTTPPVIPVPQIAGTRLPPLNLPGKKTSRPTSGKQTISKSEVLLANARPSSGQLGCTQFAGLTRCTPGNIRPKSCHDGKTWSRPEQLPEGSKQELDLNSVVSKLSQVSLKPELRHQGEGEPQADHQDRDVGNAEVESYDVPYEASCPSTTGHPTLGEGPPPKGVISPSHQRLPMPSEIFCEAGDGHYLHPTERLSVHDVISPCRSGTFLSPGMSSDAMRPRSGSCAPGDTPQRMTPRSPVDGQSSPEQAEKSRDRLAECHQIQGLSMDQIGSIRQQLYEEGLKPAERDGGVAFFIPMTGEGLLPQANGATISERLTRSRKCGLNYEERLILANINRQVQLHKRKEFAVKDIKNVKGATSGSESNDRNKQDDDIDMDFDCTF